MQKSSSTIVIAFLAGLVVAGGSAYVVSALRNKPGTAPAVETVAAQAPASQPASSQAAAPQTAAQAPPAEPAVAPTSAPEEPRSQARPKPKPTAAKRESPRRQSSTDDAEAAAAPQPTQAEGIEPPRPASAVPLTAAEPPGPPQALTPPSGTQTAPPPPREPKTVTIAAGTPITVRVNETISTETNYSGDTFTASLDKPLIIDGFVIADRGARVIGRVTQAEKAGRMKGVSELTLALTQIHTTDGQTVAIETTPWTKQGAQSKKSDAAKIGGGAALGAIIGAIAGGGKGAAIGAGVGGAAGTGTVLGTRGKAAEIPSETRITFSLSNNAPITEKLN